MKNEEKTAKLEFMQHFFIKSFIVSFVLLLISTVLCMVMHDFQIAFIDKYFPIEEEDYNYLIILLLGIWKILIIQFTLIPALAAWMIRKCCCCNK